MKKILASLLLVFPLSAIACEVLLGKYRTMLEGHASGSLTLMDENKFEIEFGYSEVVKPHFSKFTRYTGVWSCGDSGVNFKYMLESVNAKYRKHKSYPFGAYKDVKALVFPKNSKIYELLNVDVYWPVNY